MHGAWVVLSLGIGWYSRWEEQVFCAGGGGGHVVWFRLRLPLAAAARKCRKAINFAASGTPGQGGGPNSTEEKEGEGIEGERRLCYG